MRELNEDTYCVLTPPSVTPEIDALLAVADGMGGHQAGEIASGYVVKTLEQLFSSPVYQQWVDYSPEREDYYAAVLKEVLDRINDRLYTQASGQQELRGMGTTATVALFAAGQLFIGHVGDSRAYILHNGQMRQLTQDHSLAAQKNVLTRALGNSLLVRVDRSIHPVQPDDMLILCTDGLTNVVSDAEIQQAAEMNHDPQKACDTLVDLANQRGGPDNVTVLVARWTMELPVRTEAQPLREVEECRDTQKIPRHESKGGKSRILALVKAVLLGAFALAVAIIGAWALSMSDWLDTEHEVQLAIVAGVATLIGLVVGMVMGGVLSSQ